MKKIFIIFIIFISTITSGQKYSLGGFGKSAREIKRERQKQKAKNRERRAEIARDRALDKLRIKNRSTEIKLTSLAGYKFGQKYEDQTMMKMEKLQFNRYEYVTLKSSPMAGLCSVTLYAKDPMIESVSQIEAEIKRMADLFSKTFRVTFSSSLTHSSNEKWGTTLGVKTVSNSITGGIVGRRLEERSVIVEPATKIGRHLVEHFANYTIIIEGEKDLVNGEVTMKFQAKKRLPTK